ncbi:DUF1254 domain-containing protein [Pseudomonas sp. NPDC090755]|uniref:DUF1254 domain-containing protein n=1 Tax=Pseudomonas sp. NPDC090755 TaxID=3364481 RepID=UPI00383ACFF9
MNPRMLKRVGLLVGVALLSPAASAATLQETYEIAREAYVYAYPIVTMDVSQRQATNVADAASVPMRAPLDQFAHVRSYPRAETRDVVRLNFDTLYSSAWVDLSRGPVVLSVPDMADRYYLLPMLDMWTDVFAVVGSRTTGSKAGHYALVPPGWVGELPAGMLKIVAPTSMIWILGRTQTNGPADYEKVRKVQDSYTLTPLAQWGKAAVPRTAAAPDAAIDNTTPPLRQVNALDGVTVLSRLAGLMAKYPPHANDYPILARLRRIGLEPGKPFDPARLDAQVVDTINTAGRDALAGLRQASLRRAGLEQRNGWASALRTVGTYGTSYEMRARASLIGLGANLPEDAIYPASFTDGDGKPYDGSNRYVLHFEKDGLPPADAFWSITLYDADGFQVPNAINRFALGDRDALKFNADGSLDLYIQHQSPGGDKQANWLPAPKGTFNLALRLYSPRQAMRDGSWAPPPVKRVQEQLAPASAGETPPPEAGGSRPSAS